MNKGMQFLLKSFGLEMTPETMEMLQALIPQLPAKINEVGQVINAALANFDARLKALEKQFQFLDEHLNANMEETRIMFQEVLNGKQPSAVGVADASRHASAGRRSRSAGTATSGNGSGEGDGGSGDVSG